MAIICEKFPKFWVRWEKYIELDLKFAWVMSKIRSELCPQKRKNNPVHIPPYTHMDRHRFLHYQDNFDYLHTYWRSLIFKLEKLRYGKDQCASFLFWKFSILSYIGLQTFKKVTQKLRFTALVVFLAFGKKCLTLKGFSIRTTQRT